MAPSLTTALVATAMAGAAVAQCPQPLGATTNLTMYPCAGADMTRFQWNYVQKGPAYGPRFIQLNSNPTMCMSVVGTSPLSNTPNVGVATCDPNDYRQGWYIQLDGSVVSSQDGNVLDVYNNEVAPGTRVDTYSHNGQLNQQWSWNATAKLLVSALNGFCAGLC